MMLIVKDEVIMYNQGSSIEPTYIFHALEVSGSGAIVAPACLHPCLRWPAGQDNIFYLVFYIHLDS
jgi:hypothetical protein